jgi:hypothetical protein
MVRAISATRLTFYNSKPREAAFIPGNQNKIHIPDDVECPYVSADTDISTISWLHRIQFAKTTDKIHPVSWIFPSLRDGIAGTALKRSQAHETSLLKLPFPFVLFLAA